jgi:hypothetical protein
LKVLGKQVFDLLDFYFWASKREKVDQLHTCISVHRTKQSMLNNVISCKDQNNEYKIAPNKPYADQNLFKAYEAWNYMYLKNQLLYLNPNSFNASK